MPGKKKKRWFPKIKSGINLLIMMLVIAVLIISSLTFLQTESMGAWETTPSPEASPTVEASVTPADTGTSEVELEEGPPTPMEIGYTDGIIFFSSVLILIVLVGTLRETIQHKGT